MRTGHLGLALISCKHRIQTFFVISFFQH
uniref:Uncharacterized protein n=1 Tax=Arundo donax TaxID=35708 RepID=A0A0A9FUS4_ARUDO